MWFFTRHGETLYNTLGIQQGHTDVSFLTLKGIIQAQSFAYRILDKETDFSKYKFISSPLIRTRHTLQIIMEVLHVAGKIDPIVEPLLIDKNKGSFENILKQKIKELYPDEIIKAEKDYWNYLEPNATESRLDVLKRAEQFIEKYKNEENLIIVTHNSLVKYLTLFLSGKTLEEISSGDAKIKKTVNQNYFYLWNKENIEKL